MNIRFHGAAQSVGASCIAVDDEFLLDCGLDFDDEEVKLPLPFDTEKIKAVLLSHEHLDHSGALPHFHKRGLRCPIYITSLGKDIARTLLLDSFKVGMIKGEIDYARQDVINVLKNMIPVPYGKMFRKHGIKATYLYSGHIPGSASVLMEKDGKKVLYTSDINEIDTHLLKGATYAKTLRNVDVMICEATYGGREHPDRKTEEAEFLKLVKKTVDRGGTAMVPTFSVGRAQEIVMMLGKSEFDVPIYLDGMAKKICNLVKQNPEHINNIDEFLESLKKVKFVHNWKERKDIVDDERGVIITTSGMLAGGPILEYLKHHYDEKKSSVLMTGYQAPGTNGKLLDEGKEILVDGQSLKVQCEVRRFDFSAHSGNKELLRMIKEINPKLLIPNHGEAESVRALANACKNDRETIIAQDGEDIEV